MYTNSYQIISKSLKSEILTPSKARHSVKLNDEGKIFTHLFTRGNFSCNLFPSHDSKEWLSDYQDKDVEKYLKDEIIEAWKNGLENDNYIITLLENVCGENEYCRSNKNLSLAVKNPTLVNIHREPGFDKYKILLERLDFKTACKVQIFRTFEHFQDNFRKWGNDEQYHINFDMNYAQIILDVFEDVSNVTYLNYIIDENAIYSFRIGRSERYLNKLLGLSPYSIKNLSDHNQYCRYSKRNIFVITNYDISITGFNKIIIDEPIGGNEESFKEFLREKYNFGTMEDC